MLTSDRERTAFPFATFAPPVGDWHVQSRASVRLGSNTFRKAKLGTAQRGEAQPSDANTAKLAGAQAGARPPPDNVLGEELKLAPDSMSAASYGI